MNVRDVLRHWSEHSGLDDYRVVALVIDQGSDDEFPFEAVDIVAVEPDSDEDTVNLVMAADDDETPTLTVAEARFILNDLVGTFGDSEVFVREEIPGDDGHWVTHDAPVIATADHHDLHEFAFTRWYEGCDAPR